MNKFGYVFVNCFDFKVKKHSHLLYITASLEIPEFKRQSFSENQRGFNSENVKTTVAFDGNDEKKKIYLKHEKSLRALFIILLSSILFLW